MIPPHEDREPDRPEPRPPVEPAPKVGSGRRGWRLSLVPHQLGAFARRFEFATGAIGFLLGLAVMTWGSLPWPGDHLPDDAFLRRPEALVWVFLVAAQFGFWFNAVPFQWRWRRTIKDEFHIQTTREIWAKHLLALVLFIIPLALIARSLPAMRLAYLPYKVMLVNIVGVSVAFVAIEGIWYVRAALGDRRWEHESTPGDETETKDRVKAYLDLKEGLGRFITFLGAMISLGTLAKGASRHAFIELGGCRADFPPEYILLHGAYFTGLLALVYVPTHTRLMAAGGVILDSVFPVAAPDLELKKLADWQSNRKSLEELLQLHVSSLDNLRASVTILAPLASGMVSVLIGDKLMLDTK